MGYTHSWALKSPIDTEAFVSAVEDIKRIRKALKLPIRGAHGSGKPVLQADCICFNGDAKTGGAYETFRVALSSPEWDFCKTNRKPYDLMVCCSLIALWRSLKVDGSFSFTSDGTPEDWEPALAAYHKHSLYPIEGTELRTRINKILKQNKC